jgi:ketosteroid isomerase-like protein
MTDRAAEQLDKEEIRDLSRRYMRGLDRLDLDLLASVFHDDATVDYGFYQGSARDFVAFAFEALKDHLANHHMLGQMLVQVDGDEAVGEIYFQAFHRIVEDGDEKDLFISGRYVDRYLRRDGVWKMAFRSEVNDWARTDPATDVYFRTNPAGLRGARAPEDYSTKFFKP